MRFHTRGGFECVLSQFYIGLWALWDNYIWEEKHSQHYVCWDVINSIRPIFNLL